MTGQAQPVMTPAVPTHSFSTTAAERTREVIPAAAPRPVRPLDADGLRVGASGSAERISGKVMQVIDGNQMLVGIEDARTGDGRRSTWIMVKCSTAGITDDKFFGTGWKDVVGSNVLKVTGTTTYKTAGGSTKTVFVLEPVSNP